MRHRHRNLVLSALAMAYGSTAASADTLNFKVSNKSSAAINSITAIPKGGTTSFTLTTAAIAAAATSPITFAAPGGVCVFALTTTLASGRIIASPDTDLCQTDVLVVQ